MTTHRREFLKFIGYSSLGVMTASQFSCATLKSQSVFPVFSPIAPSNEDDVVLAKGFSYDQLISWGEKINTKGETFGFNNDYTAFLPLPSGADKKEAVLWVNHESTNPLFVSGYKKKDGRGKTLAQVKKERESVGGSILKIEQKTGSMKWEFNANDPLNRRIDGLTKIPFSSDRKIKGSIEALGTLANCAGGITPWGTILTCEENYQDFYGETVYKNGKIAHKSKNKKLSWEFADPQPPEHYGWVVEVDIKNGQSKKLIPLGRFSHECATTTTDKQGRAVVYMADDANDECVYKFISEKPGRLDRGQLFVADTVAGQWLELSWDKNQKLRDAFKDQQEVLIRCREAAKLVGGTPLNRPEDIEINPKTGEIYIALTNNKPKGNFHGSLLKIAESDSDYASLSFKASEFLLGGENNNFSCPDNLIFDRKGNLWMTNDISGKSIGKGPYKKFKNNGLFYIPLSGEFAGQVLQVASAPVEAEFTGLSFSEDQKTLFLSVQHPGENSPNLDNLRSHWPSKNKKDIPRPSVICLHGPALTELTT